MSTVESLFCRSAPWGWASRKVLLPWALQGEAIGGRVLEIGGGGGVMAAQLLAASGASDPIQLTMTDFDPVMVDTAGRRLARFGDRVTTRVADATALPSHDDAFDVVVTFLMLHHVVEWERALTEAVRVVRPGGIVIGYDLLGSSPARLVHRLEGAPHRFIRRGQLRTQLASLPLSRVSVRENPFFVRFALTKAAGPEEWSG